MMLKFARVYRFCGIFLTMLVVACSTTAPERQASAGKTPVRTVKTKAIAPQPVQRGERDSPLDGERLEVTLFALGLLDVGYQFGGSNPEAGLDCSGLVRYVYKEAVGVDLPHNAAALVKFSHPVARTALQPGDLVFFNTLGYAYSHVGIYLGDNKFIHAPSSKGRVRVELLSSSYFGPRFLEARSVLQN